MTTASPARASPCRGSSRRFPAGQRMNILRHTAIAVIAACTACPMRACAVEFTLSAPDSSLTLAVRDDSSANPFAAETDLRYAVTLGEDTALEWSPLGLRMTEPAFSGRLRLASHTYSAIDETYATRSGKKLLHRNRCNELTLICSTGVNLMVSIVMRAYNDGVAFRYVLEEGRDRVAVSEDLSGFAIPVGSAGWMQEVTKNYEATFDSFTVGHSMRFSDYGNFPALFRTPDNAWVLLTEASLYGRFGACHFSIDETSPGLYRLTLPQPVVAGDIPWALPWRVAVIGPHLGAIVESNLVEHLNPPSAVADTSWIRPGRVAWSWWSDGDSPSSLSVQKRYVDFAENIGWEYVLVDQGWKAGFMPELSDYALQRNVGLFLWYRWTDLQAPHERAAAFSQLDTWGVKGIKVDFVDNDGHDRMAFYEDLLSDAAGHGLMVNFHGTTLYRGQRRRWPHCMTMEAVRGAEHYKFDASDNGYPSPAQNCVLPYTRNAVGPMDYTPVTFSTPNRATTEAHELALSVVFESGLQHFADKPDVYEKSPGYQFLAGVPAAWDNTRFLAGYPGRYACLARRAGNDWCVAGINAGPSRTVDITLPFARPGVYAVIIYGDDAGGRLTSRRRTVDTRGTTTLSMAANGGFCFAIEDAFDAERDSLAMGIGRARRNAGLSGAQAVVVRRQNGAVEIESRVRGTAAVRVVDMKGRLVVARAVGRGERVLVRKDRLAAGVHVLSVSSGSVRTTRRLIHR
ncbi:MAG: glycoside hydrolase family 97 protein [Chitinivibrionales bacterium]|nr:glycoside hydrolase family 97 protein [Chitinivibrionales bacterium]MBD3396422.1 glycoside hydrolase family 97 protein [Chitinivibrionales bacterium]